jgi:phospholipase C
MVIVEDNLSHKMKFLHLLGLAASKILEINDGDPANENITNIVVLMLENRSFDTFLGRLQLDGMNTDINGISERMVNYAENTQIGTRNVDKYTGASKCDPGHEIGDVTEQIYGPGFFNGIVAGKKAGMNGFAENVFRNYAHKKVLPECLQQVFGLHGNDTLPVTYALAQEFSVVDDWFSSVPGPTFPNRHFLQCATSLGRTGNKLNYLTGLRCKTVFENLSEKNISWNVYRFLQFNL